MPTKQLEILVTARDQASATFNQVATAAEGTGEKFSAINELAETGHGLHKMLRTARNIAIAFEFIPVGVDAAKAAFEALEGTSEDAARAQQQLLDGIREIPLVGKPAAEAAKFLGDAIANALGNETTDEIIADMKEVEEAQKEFIKSTAKFDSELRRLRDEAELAGKTGAEREAIVEKQKTRKLMEELDERKKAINDFGKVVTDDQKNIDELKANIAKPSIFEIFGLGDAGVGDKELKDAEAKLAADQQANANAMAEEGQAKGYVDQIVAAGPEQKEKKSLVPDWLKSLGEIGRSAWGKVADAVKTYDEQQKRAKDEGQRLWEESLPPLQKYNDELKRAVELLKEGAISQRQFEDIQHAHDQKTKDHSEGVDRGLMRDKIDMLRQEGDLGDKAASREAEKLEIQQRYNDERKKLLAILNDQQATESQKSQAKDLLSHLDSDESKAEAGAGKGKEGPAQLAQLEVSQFLTGVSAKAEQEKGDPELDESKKQTGLLATIAANLGNMLQGKNAIPTKVSFGG